MPEKQHKTNVCEEVSRMDWVGAGHSPDNPHDSRPTDTDRGNVPEALRLAHLIGAAVKLGERGKRA